MYHSFTNTGRGLSLLTCKCDMEKEAKLATWRSCARAVTNGSTDNFLQSLAHVAACCLTPQKTACQAVMCVCVCARGRYFAVHAMF